MSVPWGDIATAFYTTGIKNITVFWPASDAMINMTRYSAAVRPLLRLGFVQALLKMYIDTTVRGPSEDQREQQNALVWGEVRNAGGESVTARMTTANGYTVTQLAPVAIIEHLLHDDVKAGSTTPALLMGKEFASQLRGSSDISITRQAL